MDMNDIRSIVTVVSLAVFLGIVRWAWSRSNASRFEAAANLPFADEPAAHDAPSSDNNPGSRP
jgi:cytochrome c oxidase cbb3-type subunit IV